jgi:hypothetical protein
MSTMKTPEKPANEKPVPEKKQKSGIRILVLNLLSKLFSTKPQTGFHC